MRTLILAAAAAALLAGSATAAPPAAGAKPASKMSGCASQWKAMSAADKGKYNDKAKGMKSKKGNSLSGYNVWTGECMKK
ncbi:MAG: hypothetical protein INR64_14665 [Caulobacteraceae bacterium]|nr:hypothetical protein [Caulobacter sp.]